VFSRLVLQRLRSLAGLVLGISARLNSPFLGALAFVVLARSQKINEPKSVLKRVVFIGSLANSEDIQDVSRWTTDISFYIFERTRFHSTLQFFFNGAIPSEESYHQDLKFQTSRNLSLRYMSELLGWSQKIFKIDGIITTNIGYVGQQAFLEAAQQRNIWSIVLFKEGFCNPKLFEESYGSLKTGQILQSNVLLCAAEYIRSGFLKFSKKGLVSGISPEKVRITGIPRLDRYAKLSLPQNDSVDLCFFTFDWRLKMVKDELTDLQKIEMDCITESLYDWVIELGRLFPECRVVIKTKSKKKIDAEDAIYKTLSQKIIGAGNPKNICLTSDVSAETLVRQSRRILSHGSTTLIEGLLAGKSVGCPDYRSILGESKFNIFEDHDELVNYINSFEDLCRWVREIVEPQYSGSQKDKFIEKYFRNTDARASMRVAEVINELP
jgi:hypothetical protein